MNDTPRIISEWAAPNSEFNRVYRLVHNGVQIRLQTRSALHLGWRVLDYKDSFMALAEHFVALPEEVRVSAK